MQNVGLLNSWWSIEDMEIKNITLFSCLVNIFEQPRQWLDLFMLYCSDFQSVNVSRLLGRGLKLDLYFCVESTPHPFIHHSLMISQIASIAFPPTHFRLLLLLRHFLIECNMSWTNMDQIEERLTEEVHKYVHLWLFFATLQRLQDGSIFMERDFHKHCCGCHVMYEETVEFEGQVRLP